jgi:hypothetical protein
MKTKIFTILSFFLLPELAFSKGDALQAKPSAYGTSKNVHCPIEIKPGIGIGPLELGQSLNEVESLGMDMKTVQGSKDLLIVGRYSIGLNDQRKLRFIEAEIGDLPNCIYFGKHKIKKTSSGKQLAKLFLGCGKEASLEGGKSIQCDGVVISTDGWGGQQKTPALKILPQ